MAKQFIKHALELNAETIAFILPNTFNKFTLQAVFPQNWALINVIPLDCEYQADNIDYFVPSSFFIWTRKPCGINKRKQKPIDLKDFYFLNRGDTSADFTINGNTGKIKNLKDVTNDKAEHYIKVTSGKDVEEIKNKIRETKFNFYSSVNGGVAWMSQNDILEDYYERWGNEKTHN